MLPIALSAIRDLTVPAAALAFGGCALILFTLPGHGPSRAPSAIDAPTVAEQAPPRRDIRRIAIGPSTSVASDPVAVSEIETALPPIRALASVTPPNATVERPECSVAKATVPTPIRAATVRRPAEARPARVDKVVARMPAKPPVRVADAAEDQGLVAKTLGAGSHAAAFVVGGVKTARDTAFGLGRSVASLVGDTL